MKQSAILILIVIICTCSSNKVKPVVGDENLLGKWKVIEQLSDPGDGSGTFNPIESNRTIQFFSDNKVTINGSLCHMSIDVGLNMPGIYEVLGSNAEDTSFDGVIYPEGCEFAETEIYFNLPDSGNLILWYPYIEGCGQKFQKI